MGPGGMGGSDSALRYGARSPSSSSPVLVSEAVSEASDVAHARDHLAEMASPPAATDADNGSSENRKPATNLPPLATLLGSDAATPVGRGRSAANAHSASGVPIEEQFECVSNHLLQSAQRSASAACSAAKAKAATATPAGGKAKAGTQPAATPVTPAQALTLDWEAELRAELS